MPIFGVSFFIADMKIRRLPEFQGRFVYPNFDTDHALLMGSFLETRLGGIYLKHGQFSVII